MNNVTAFDKTVLALCVVSSIGFVAAAWINGGWWSVLAWLWGGSTHLTFRYVMRGD